jgi:hypothetical protein
MKWAGNIMDTLAATAGGRKMREVSQSYGIPVSTLEDRYKSGQLQEECLINMFLRINHAPQFSITKIGKIYASIMRVNTVYRKCPFVRVKYSLASVYLFRAVFWVILPCKMNCLHITFKVTQKGSHINDHCNSMK